MVQVTIKPNNKKYAIDILSDAINRKKEIIKIAIQKTKDILEAFEKKFNMKTSTFHSKYTRGKLSDKTDFIEWAGEKEIIDRLKKEYRQIQEIHFVH